MFGITKRVLFWGLMLALLMCAINSDLTLQVGVIEEGFVQTTLMGFIIITVQSAILGVIARIIPRIGKNRIPITEEECVLIGTMGSAGGSLAFIANVFAALRLSGSSLSLWQMTIFAVVVSFGGLVMAVPFRMMYVVKNPLRWAIAIAGVETIKTLVSGKGSLQTKILVRGSILAFVWIFGVGMGCLPEVSALPFGLGSAGFIINWSPFILGAGYLVGMRVGWGFGLGAVVLVLMAQHVEGAPHKFVYPGVAALLACGVVGIICKYRMIWEAFKSLSSAGDASPTGAPTTPEDQPVFSNRTFKRLALCVGIVTVGTLRVVFNIPILVSTAGCLLAFTVLELIAMKAAGDTGFNPVRVFGCVIMLLFAAMGQHDAYSTLLGAGIVAAGIGATGILVQDNFIGRAYKVPAKKQFIGQTLVLVPASLVCALVFNLLDTIYGIGSDKLPASVAILWSTIADILSGTKPLPPFAKEAMWIGAGAGVILGILDEIAGRKIKNAQETKRSTLWRFMPHSLGISLGMLLPIPADLAFFVGALVLCWALPRFFKTSDEALVGVASAGIVGEGISNLVVAGLAVLGIMGPFGLKIADFIYQISEKWGITTWLMGFVSI